MATPKRKVQLDMSSEVFDPVFALAEKTYPGTPGGASAVTRELILMALGHAPIDAARQSARRMAYLDAMVVARSGLGRALTEIGHKLEASGVVAESERSAILKEIAETNHDQ